MMKAGIESLKGKDVEVARRISGIKYVNNFYFNFLNKIIGEKC